jgi:hypothetical protein
MEDEAKLDRRKATDSESEKPRRLSARASRAGAALLSDEEIEAAEAEAEAWARRVNSC